MADKRSDEDKAKDCEAMLAVLAQIRLPYEAMIDNIFTYMLHNRRKIADKDAQKGQKTGIEVYDGTALGALNLLADGLAGYTISRSFRWFEYTLPTRLNFPRWSGMRAWSGKRMDEYPDVKNWLESAEEVMYAAFLKSNLYDVAPEIIRDAAGPGTVNVFIEEDVKAGRTIYTVPHFRECFIAENAFGEVDTNYRVLKYTLKQMVEKFTIEKMTEAIPDFKERHNKNPHEELEVIHACYPRADRDPGKVNGKNKPHASLWVLRSPQKLLLESGYEENQSVTWRWRKNSDEWYGRSPSWDAYIDVMTGNQQGKSNLVAGHKMVEPPIIAPLDLRGQINDGPRGKTFVEGQVTKERIPIPLLTGIQLPFAIEMQDRTDKKIREHFHVDFFLMLSQAAQSKIPITATQVIEMTGEKAAVLGPRIGRMESECLNPIHDREFAIQRRAGRIPEPPQILLDYAGQNVETDYMGPLSQAQKKLFKSQGIRSGLEAIAPLYAVHPEIVDIIDPDKTGRELLESSGFPAKCLRDEKAIEAVRAQRIEQERAKQAATEAAEAAKALPAVGKAPEEGSPLEAIMTGAMGNA